MTRRFRPRAEELEGRVLLSLSPVQWTPIGPRPVQTSVGAIAGRLTTAVFDPGDPTGNTAYVAGNRDGGFGEGAGIWKTTNWRSASPTWTQLVDDQPSMDIAAHCLAMAPTNHDVLYAAVSGPNGGILRTADGGAHWQYLSTGLFSNTEFFACVVSPLDENVVYVAVWNDPTLPGGVYRSVDGGQSFVNITPVSFGAVSASDVVIDPSNPTNLYAALEDDGGVLGGVFQVTDTGPASPQWQQLTNGIASGSNVGDYVELAMAPSDSQVLYATVFYNTNVSGNPVLERFITTDGGGSWTQLDLTPLVSGHRSDDRYWHAVLGVDPTDPFVFYVNGDEPLLYKAVYKGGGTVDYTPINDVEDHVQVTFDLQHDVVLLSDRGVLMNPDPTTLDVGWQDKRQDLGNVTFYNVTLDPNNPAVAYGVAQDQLDILQYTGTRAWQYLNAGSEIGRILVDPSDSNTIYNFSPPQENPSGLGAVSVSHDGGASFQDASTGLLPGSFPSGDEFFETAYNAFAINAANPKELVLGTPTSRVYRTTDGAKSWSFISPVLSSGWFLTGIAIGPDDGTIYAATGDGKFWVAPPNPDATTKWTERDAGLPIDPGNTWIQSVVVDPNDSRRIFVAYTTSNDPENGGSVWFTANGGLSWTQMTGDLPKNFSYQSLALDWRFAHPNVYVATSRGVYATDQLRPAAHWTPAGVGLPHTLVNDVEIDPKHGVLAAATYGRGVFELLLPGPARIATGPGRGQQGRVNVYDGVTRTLLFSRRPFGSSFKGGVRVAVGDLNGDGVSDVLAGSGPGVPATVVAFDGASGRLLFAFRPCGRFAGGVYVAAGDVNGDGVTDIVIGQGQGGGLVRAFSGRGGRLLANFRPFGVRYAGGVTVAAGNVRGTRAEEIVVGRATGAPLARVFSGDGRRGLVAFRPSAARGGGVFVAAGDLDGDGFAEVITGLGPGTLPLVSVFPGGGGPPLFRLLPYPRTFKGGVRVAAGDLDGDGTAELLTGPGPGRSPQVFLFAGRRPASAFFAYDPLSVDGVFVAGG